MQVVIITDSRGRGLHKRIERLLPGFQVQVLVHSGAGYELAAIKSLGMIKKLKPGIIIMMAGVCDITWRDRKNKVTRIRYETTQEVVGHVMGTARAAYEILEAMGSHRISFATVTGLNLTDYNFKPRKFMTSEEYDHYARLEKTDHPQQPMLNDSVIEINRQITEMNKKNRVPSTWTSTTVHSYYRKMHHHNYKKLEDGCHPDEDTKDRWATQIVKSIQRIGRGMR